MFTSLPVDEHTDFTPICPHCETGMDRLIARLLQASILSRRFVYACPNCFKVLGVTHRKGLLAN